jgi:hypothetical protein
MSVHPSAVPLRPANYDFVNFENIHEVNLGLIGSKDVVTYNDYMPERVANHKGNGPSLPLRD